jgi:rhamnogalacturonan acetylesterase
MVSISNVVSLVGFAVLATSSPAPNKRATTLYLAGDSTMAKGGGGSGTNGISTAIIPYNFLPAG